MQLLGRVALVVLVVAAASALWWLDNLRERRPAPAVDPQARHEPDYYFNDFRLRAHDVAGAPRYVLVGERLVHYADDGTAEVTGPRVRYGGNGDAPWRLRGRRGILSPGGDEVRLLEDVVMRREPARRPPVVLRTTRLTVYTEAGRAETEQPVEIAGPGWQVDAVGMTAHFDPGLIELHDNVRGRYDPAITP